MSVRLWAWGGERSRRCGRRVRETQVQTPVLTRLSCVNSHKLVNLSQAAQSSLSWDEQSPPQWTTQELKEATHACTQWVY